MDSYTDVCRLCSSTHDLLWVFDKKLPGAATISLKDIIFAISGVEIHYKDVISQKICSECYQLAKITYGFREMSIKSNKILKVAIIPLQAD
ncbi:zinc finger protein Paris isoform X12 [Leptinotarsa decemlineata]|uniref:zinc finger protein Paris isoform X12 n=1 Tax=Leptinotarsa decemlineata TaxID=7539 RepID=UPI003D308820